MYTSNPPSTYAWVSGLDLSNITARLYVSSPYSPQMVFIGWCSDAELTQPITNMPQYSMGDITLYAKWRYDYTSVSATREHGIIGDQKKIYFYGDETENSYLGEIAFSFGTGVYTTTAYLPIDTIKDIDILYLRYGGTGSFFNVWSTDQLFLKIMYVAAQADATAVSFTWANQNPFN